MLFSRAVATAKTLTVLVSNKFGILSKTPLVLGPGDSVRFECAQGSAPKGIRLQCKDRVAGPFAVTAQSVQKQGWFAQVAASELARGEVPQTWTVQILSDEHGSATDHAAYREEPRKPEWSTIGTLTVLTRHWAEQVTGAMAPALLVGAIAAVDLVVRGAIHGPWMRGQEAALVALATVVLAVRWGCAQSRFGWRVVGAIAGVFSLVSIAHCLHVVPRGNVHTIYNFANIPETTSQLGVFGQHRIFTTNEIRALALGTASRAEVRDNATLDACERAAAPHPIADRDEVIVCQNRWAHIDPAVQRYLGVGEHGNDLSASRSDCVDFTSASCVADGAEHPPSVAMQRPDQTSSSMGPFFDWHPAVSGRLFRPNPSVLIRSDSHALNQPLHVQTWGPHQVTQIETVNVSPILQWFPAQTAPTTRFLTTVFELYPMNFIGGRQFRLRMSNGDSLMADCEQYDDHIVVMTVDSAAIAALQVGPSRVVRVGVGQSTVALCSTQTDGDVIFYLRRPADVSREALARSGAWSQRMLMPQGMRAFGIYADAGPTENPHAFDDHPAPYPGQRGGSHRVEPDVWARTLQNQVATQRTPPPVQPNEPRNARMPWMWIQLQWPGTNTRQRFAPFDDPYREETITIESIDGSTNIIGANIH